MKLNIKSLLSLSVAAITLIFTGCTKDNNITNKDSSNIGNRVRFSISNLSTRATGSDANPTPTIALEREKQVSSLYAVVYKENGLYFNTIECLKESGTTNTYYFDVKAKGLYQFRFVANPDEDLLNKLKSTSSVIGDLQDIVVSKSPGEDNKAKDFVLVSDKYEATVSENKTVNLNSSVKLTRLSARFDFLNRVPDLEITKITFGGRVTQSYLYARTDISTLNVSNDKTYEAAQGLTGKVCEGVIYGYENPRINKTSFTIEGTYKGKPIAPYNIPLTNIAVKRNYLYTIVINPLGGNVDPGTPDNPSTSDILNLDIKVLDWNMDDEELHLKELDTYRAFYVDYSANVSNASFMDSFLVDSPSSIYTVTSKETDVYINVGAYMIPAVLELENNTVNGVKLEKTGKVQRNDDGKYIQKYKLHLPAIKFYDPLAEFQGLPESNFTTVNLIAKSQTSEVTHKFTVYHGRMKTPLEHLSEYPLGKIWKDNADPARTPNPELELAFNTTYENDKQFYFNPFYATQILSKPGVVIDGKTWHLPESIYEWFSVFATDIGTDNVESPICSNAPDVTEHIKEWVVLPRFRRVKANGNEFENGIIHTYADYAVNKDNRKIFYGLKFQASDNARGTDGRFLTAYRYERKGTFAKNSKTSQVIVTSRYLGIGYKGKISDIANEEFWNKDNSDDAKRIFPMAGSYAKWGGNDEAQSVGVKLICLIEKKDKLANNKTHMFRSAMFIGNDNIYTILFRLYHIEEPFNYNAPVIYLFTHEL